MEAMLKTFQNLYDEMSAAQAEGKTTGHNEKLLSCRYVMFA